MKNIFTIILAVFLTGNLFSQTLEQNIQEIRKQFNWINNQKDFEKIYLENEEFTDQVPSEGASLECFYKNQILYKVNEMYAVSNAVYTNSYYLKNNKLIFVYRTEKSYTPSEDHSEKIKLKTDYEERVYYKKGKIIRHLEKGKSYLQKNTDFQAELSKLRLLSDSKIKFKKRYNLLQGSWTNADDIDDWFEIKGLTKTQYFGQDYGNTYRMWLDNRYLWFHNTENPNTEDLKYEILELTDKKLEIQNRLSGDVLMFNKNTD